MDNNIITLADLVAAGYCASGVRRWFKERDLDFRDFAKNGAPADLVLKMGGASGQHVVSLKSEQQHGN